MQNRIIAIRVDNSSFIGIGHTQRCLYIATELEKLNYEVSFISRSLSGSDYSNISSKGFKVINLSSQNINKVDVKDHANWLCVNSDMDSKETKECLKLLGCKNLIVDHYGVDQSWEKKIKDSGVNLFVIDDLDRDHYCNLLIDYSFWKKESNFSGFKNINDFAIGKDFFPLDERLLSYPKKSIDLENPVILISMGGSDQDGLTEKIITYLNKIENLNHKKIIVVINKDILSSISELASSSDNNYELHTSPNGLGEIYSQVDICIGSSGISALERCFFGIPSLIILKAKNQENLGGRLQDNQLATSVKLDVGLNLEKEINLFLKDFNKNLELHKKSLTFLSPGGAKRIASRINSIFQG